MTILGLASLKFQELVKFKHLPLAASIALGSLVEQWSSRMVNAAFSLSAAIVCRLATLPSACLSLLNGGIWVVILGFWWRGRRRLSRLGCLSLWYTWDSYRICELGFWWSRVCYCRFDIAFGFWFGSGCIVNGAVFSGCAWWDGQELVECQNAWFTASPAWIEAMSVCLVKE